MAQTGNHEWKMATSGHFPDVLGSLERWGTFFLFLCTEWNCVLGLLVPGKAWGETGDNLSPQMLAASGPPVSRVHRKRKGLPYPSHKASLFSCQMRIMAMKGLGRGHAASLLLPCFSEMVTW